MLAIGDGKQGFRLSSVDRKSALDKVEAVVASSLLDSSTEKSIRNHQEARSAVYKDVPPPQKIEPGTFWTQLRRLMKISLGPGYRARFATSTACIIAQILLRDMDEGLTGQMYVANMTTDRALAWVLIRKTMGLSVLLAGLDQVLQYTQRRFNAEIQDQLTKNLSARYLREDVFYQLKMVDGRIQDPTHRIADDVRDFAMFFTQAWPEFLSPLCHIVFFVFRLAGLSGSKETAGIIGYVKQRCFLDAFAVRPANPKSVTIAVRARNAGPAAADAGLQVAGLQDFLSRGQIQVRSQPRQGRLREHCLLWRGRQGA